MHMRIKDSRKYPSWTALQLLTIAEKLSILEVCMGHGYTLFIVYFFNYAPDIILHYC